MLVQKISHLEEYCYEQSPVCKRSKLTSINGFLGLSNMSSGIENEFIDEAGRHSSKYWTEPINLYEKKQSFGNTNFFVRNKRIYAHTNSAHN
jgi:hypothetical protein